ncbi:MAG: cell wall metabolism sensor histidine kinase WalK [Epulopiscium sp.]|nr:cell wall metabolism sensor histidine kinase WalK [Candidatus Epulonipiscium sp.]
MSQNISLQNGELVTILIKKLKDSFSSLHWTLLMTYLLVSFVPLLLFVNTIFRTMDDYFVEERKKELLSQANIISGKISSSDYMYDVTKQFKLDEEIRKISEEGNLRILVMDSTGVVIKDSGYQDEGKTYLLPEIIEALDNKDVAKKQPNGNLYAAVSIVDKNSKRIGVVFISALITDVTNTILEIKDKVYLLFVAIAIVVAMIMFFMAQLFTEPLKKMLAVIVKMSEGHLEQRVEVTGRRHNEITDLAIACNNMADKLEKVETIRQQFVSNVSHELKTPLSSIKVLSESILLQEDVPKEMYIEFLHDINSEVDRMSVIISDLLTLVKLDQKEIPLTFVETDIANLVRDIIKRLTPLAAAKNIDIEYEQIKDVFADVDTVKITLAISNLVDNAVKYTPEGGSVKITLDADHQNAFISVSDTGIGIPDEEIGKIFDRFYRVDKTRDRETGGTGLGLSITHSTVLMHNGSIKVNSKEKEGTTFLVRIPLHQNT